MGESKDVPVYQPKPLAVEVARMFFFCIPVFILVFTLAMSACLIKDVYERLKG
jgi:hypothetical protein